MGINAMPVKEKKYFEGIRAFALFTLLCTIVLWIALWGSSATPGDKSGANSWAMADAMDEKYHLSEKFDSQVTTQNIKVYTKKGTYSYIGETDQAVVQFSPSNTLDKDVVYSSNNENVATVDQNGVITFVGRGDTYIYVTLKSNPKIRNYTYVLCYGKSPHDVETPDIQLANANLKAGDSTEVYLNANTTSTLAAKITTDDESIAIYNAGVLSVRKAGNFTITATYPDGFEVKRTLTARENPSYIAPTQIVLQEKTINQNDIVDVYSLVKDVLPSGASTRCIVTLDNNFVGHFRNSNLHVTGYGEFTLTFTSCFDENVKASIKLVANRAMPTQLRVSAPSRVNPNTTVYLSAYHYPTQPSPKEVKWEIVSGKYGTITKDGVFVAKFFGTYVIRCTSTIDPSLVVEKTIEVKLFYDSGSLVRKLMGHMGLSGVLGFGLFFTCLFLCKHKWKCAVYPFVISFVHGGISELIQYFTPDRVCAFADVIVDFLGGCIGIAIGAVLFGLIALIWRLASKQSFDNIMLAIKRLNFGNCFKKVYAFDKPYEIGNKQPYDAEYAEQFYDISIDEQPGNVATNEQSGRSTDDANGDMLQFVGSDTDKDDKEQ